LIRSFGGFRFRARICKRVQRCMRVNAYSCQPCDLDSGANYLGKILPSISSRFEVFEIPSQSPETKEAVLRGLCEESNKEYPDIEFSQEVINALVDRTPREQRQLLQRALARAVLLGEAIVCLDHLEQVAPDIRPQLPKTVLGYL